MRREVVISGPPVAKPRMPRKDRFLTKKRVFRTTADAKRAELLQRYFDWCNGARSQVGLVQKLVLTQGVRLSVDVFVGMPISWSRKEKAAMVGAPHLVKPDADNFLKGVCDALFENDQMIFHKRIEKRWDDGRGPRMEISIE